MDGMMRFGRFKGKHISDVPSVYIKWCCENIKDCPSFIVDEATKRNLVFGFSPEQRLSVIRKDKGMNVPRFVSERVGSEYERLCQEFDLLDGDESECPFGDDYMGPTIRWDGGLPFMRPSEFPREYR
jgi:hypothetical protein